jgi:pimeloyl-ACP methyl ester carboxylesterase
VWVANEEKLSHSQELQKMLPYWQHITTPTIILHSRHDDLIDIKNAFFAQKMITNAPTKLVIWEGGNHYIVWNNPQLVLQNLEELYQNLRLKEIESHWQLKIYSSGDKDESKRAK